MDMIRGENERGKCDLWRLEKELRTEAGDGRLKTDRPLRSCALSLTLNSMRNKEKSDLT